jgi:hypothetical protein
LNYEKIPCRQGFSSVPVENNGKLRFGNNIQKYVEETDRFSGLIIREEDSRVGILDAISFF